MPEGENMNIIEKLLTVNPYSRPGRRNAECKGVIIHYVGIPGQRAATTWNYFEKTCPFEKHFSSAHYIIDLNGDIYHAIPDNEISYHCGSEKTDPKSGRIYTDWAREKFGYYASDPVKTSTNYCTLGIELCIDASGNFTPETINAAVELTALLIEKNNLTAEDIGHHQKVVGWKDCPLPWVKEPVLFEEFKDCVRVKLGVLL
jgi:N-acetylmuramoyl-L-alanine amidase